MNPDIHAAIAAQLIACQKPLLLSHIRPDGDAIGSIIGLGLALKNTGKSPQLVLEDGLPSKYRFIQGSELVTSKVRSDYDLVITLDCSDQDRLGEIGVGLKVDINIDHHITNEKFGEINLIEPNFPATAEILAENLPGWGFKIDVDIANALLMGILTDTIGFRTSNVLPDTLRQSAKLMDIGADLGEIYLHSLVSQSFPASLLWGKALSRLTKENGLVWTVITLDDRKEAKYSGRDDADLTNILSSIEGSDMAILFNEQNDGKVKISWRSNPPYDVSWVAQQFGGGGHPPASGAEVEGSLEDVVNKILEFTKQYMKDFHSKGEQSNGK
jgi:phosphoesterase RecJ-like protein